MHTARSMSMALLMVVGVGAPAAFGEPFPAEDLARIDARTSRIVDQVIVLTQLSGVYDDSGMAQDARRTLDRAIALAEEAPAGRVRDWLRNKTANKLAHSYSSNLDGAALRDFERAVELAARITEPDLAAHAYAKLGEKWAKAGGGDKARALLSKSIEHARRIQDPKLQAAAFASTGKELASIGEREKAASVLNEGVALAKACDDVSVRIGLLTELAGALFTAERKQDGMDVLKQAEKEAANAPADKPLVDREKPSALLHLAGLRVDLDQRDEAIILLRQAKSQIEALPKASRPDALYEHGYRLEPQAGRAKLECELAATYAAAGDEAEGLRIGRAIEDKRYRAMVLAKIAGSKASASPKQAAELLAEARALEPQAANIRQQLEILLVVAKGHVKLHSDPVVTAQVLGELEKRLPAID